MATACHCRRRAQAAPDDGLCRPHGTVPGGHGVLGTLYVLKFQESTKQGNQVTS
jgi:hypothetical protein